MLALLTAACVGACASDTTAFIAIEGVSPSELIAGVGGTVTVSGSGFPWLVSVDFDGKVAQVQPDFELWLMAEPEAIELAFTLVDAQKLSATVPAAAPPGLWPVRMVSGSGQVTQLPDALSLVSPQPCVTDADCADDDPCTADERCGTTGCTATLLESTVWWPDRDGDGFGDDAPIADTQSQVSCVPIAGFAGRRGDCDDDPSAGRCGAACFPGNPANDSCGLDLNCDGELSAQGDATWFADVDGDGYGDESVSYSGCDPPPGYVLLGGDCNDDPFACGAGCAPTVITDPCDGADNNCNGVIDEDGLVAWYPDRDGDGYGDPSDAVQACQAPQGYVADGTDCDDEPTACGQACSPAAGNAGADGCDGWDNDCDGEFDEDGPFNTWFRDADGDGAGSQVDKVLACSAPDGYVDVGGDCDDSPTACGADCGPGEVEICDGWDNDCDAATADGAQDPLFGTACDGDDPDECANGLLKCGFGTLTCSEDTGATGETTFQACNDGVDNDCDGATDADDTDCEGFTDVGLSTQHVADTDFTVHEGTSLGFTGTSPFSLCAWFKAKPSTEPHTLMGKMDAVGSRAGYRLVRSGSVTQRWGLELNHHHSTNRLHVKAEVLPGVLDDGAWHFLCACYDGGQSSSGVSVYIDGLAQVTVVDGDSLTDSLSNSAVFSLGSHDGLHTWAGNLDETTVWTTALTATQVEALYNDGAPIAPTLLPFSALAAAWWRHGDGDTYPIVTDHVGNNHGDMGLMPETSIVQDTP